jgi:hypothetical protein
LYVIRFPKSGYEQESKYQSLKGSFSAASKPISQLYTFSAAFFDIYKLRNYAPLHPQKLKLAPTRKSIFKFDKFFDEF